jgi:hypothetical protein
MRIRYHLDENIHGGVGRGLARRGIDASTTHEARLIGSPDQSQLEFAAREQRVLVTHDSDLLSISSHGVHHAGIAYRHPEKCAVGDLIYALTELWRTRTAEEMIDQIVFLPLVR